MADTQEAWEKDLLTRYLDGYMKGYRDQARYAKLVQGLVGAGGYDSSAATMAERLAGAPMAQIGQTPARTAGKAS